LLFPPRSFSFRHHRRLTATPPESVRENTPAATGVVMLNPLEDSCWDRKVGAFADATAFHGAGWARVLHETYGYTPYFPATTQGAGIGSLLPLMECSSMLTGRRGVSLPFTDFCDPLCSPGHDAGPLVETAIRHAGEKSWRYVEFRTNSGFFPSAPASARHLTHRLDLAKDEDALWSGLDGAARRSIRKARDAGVIISTGRDDAAMRGFFRLHCLTRKRHGVPPQSYAFFSNIRRFLADEGAATIMLASHRGRTIAAAVFLHAGRRVIYKFGASDFAFQHLRPNNLLMWEAIRRFAAEGMRDLHMGRSESDNAGLRRYKLAWGATEEELCYHRHSPAHGNFITGRDPQQGWQQAAFRRLPLPVLKIIGSLAYPHMA
jgi:CelD/BcsL family acetyltransferase involved in cellulose biosynthesis